jgi:crotonobetainyl-CoA:carnitine CoA-transferase CaiB-like acyl-CoA transferase
MNHPQLRHNGQVIAVDDPRVGRTEQLAPFVVMSATPGRVARRRRPGEHTAETLDASRGALVR